MFDGGFDSAYVSLCLLLRTALHTHTLPRECHELTFFSVQFMRDILLFFGVKFKVTPYRKTAASGTKSNTANGENGEDEEEEDEDEEEERNPTLQVAEGKEGTGEVLISCVGIGYSNVNKAMA